MTTYLATAGRQQHRQCQQHDSAKTETRQPKALPAPNSDFYQLADVLTAEERAIVRKGAAHTWRPRSQPIINKYWSDDCVSIRAFAFLQGVAARWFGL